MLQPTSFTFVLLVTTPLQRVVGFIKICLSAYLAPFRKSRKYVPDEDFY